MILKETHNIQHISTHCQKYKKHKFVKPKQPEKTYTIARKSQRILTQANKSNNIKNYVLRAENI